MSDIPIALDGIELIVHTLWFIALALGVIRFIGWVECALQREHLACRLAEVRAQRTVPCALCANPRALVGLITLTRRSPIGFSLTTAGVCADCAALAPHQQQEAA